MMIIFILKNGTIHLKMYKTSIFKIFFPCLYIFTLPKYRKGSGSGENFPDPDPSKKVQIRPDSDPDPQPSNKAHSSDAKH